MQLYESRVTLYSPSDLVTFLGCPHATSQDYRSLFDHSAGVDDDATLKLLQKKGYEHEANYLEILRKDGLSVIEIPKDRTLAERATMTRDAMRSGAQIIYQAVFFQEPWRGDSDFLIKCSTPSNLGQYS